MSSLSLWTVRTDRPLLWDDEVILAPDERSRAKRFRSPQDQRRYRLMRIALRRLLGQTLDCSPQIISFRYSAHGKPLLAWPDVPIYFNISHSGDYGLIGMADNQLIGVDLELMDLKSNFLALAQRFFAPSESVWLSAQSQANQTVAFYQLWTAKEAFLKATGLGISGGLDKVIVSSNLRQYEALPDPHRVEHWQLRSQPFFDHYWGAIALNTPEKSLDSVEIKTYGGE